jgi:hypothetical protein
MTRAAVVLVAFFAIVGTATAAVIHGTKRGDRINTADGARQTVACGRGLDVVNADPADLVRRDCETIARRIARDTTNVSGAQHSTIVEPDSLSFGSTLVATFQVGRIVDGGAGAIGWASSVDAGATWRSGVLPGIGHASDPSVGYDAVHGVWMAVTLGIQNGPNSIEVSRSTDGRTWSAPVTAASFRSEAFDKEWIVCDNSPTSARRGACYVAFTDIRANQIAVISSSDGGATWGGPAPAGPSGDVVGALPKVVAQLQSAPTPGLRVPPLPSTELARDGRALLVWPDCRFRSACSGNDIVLATSADGVAWTAPRRITTGGGSYVVPGIAADSRSGALAVVAAVILPGGQGRLGAVLAVSRDGVRWRPPRRLDAVTMQQAWLPRAGGAFLGDYLSASWAGGRPFGFVPLALRPVGGALRQSLYAGTTR